MSQYLSVQREVFDHQSFKQTSSSQSAVNEQSVSSHLFNKSSYHQSLKNFVLFVEKYRSLTGPVNIVGEGESNGEHLVQGDQGDGEDGGDTCHPEHEAHSAVTRGSLKMYNVS